MKRVIDLIVSFMALIILFPLFITIITIIKLSIGSPVIFKQRRPGLNNTIFEVYKFRSMNDKRDNNGILLPDEMRITRVGKIMRKLSLDELPQLWNVFKGDMSFVGPRPLLVEYLPLYNKRQAKRHNVRPGITGWAQVNGRNNISWEEKFELDIWYIENQTILLDIKILFLTLKKVLLKEGINQEGHVTTSKFTGNK